MKLYRKRIYGIYLFVFLVFLYIFWKVPYCHDEWAWGLPDHMEMMKKWFDGYNGRYLGNMLALLITRSALAKSVLLAFVMVGMLIVMGKIIIEEEEKQEMFYLLFCTFFLLSIPRTLFNQSYGWVAAFVNFIPPVLLFLIYYLWVVKPYVYTAETPVRGACKLLLIPVCFSAQLFSEHNTVFHVMFAGCVLIYGLVRWKKIRMCDVLCLFSYVMGAAMMFLNSAYRNAADDTDGYKHITFSVRKIVDTYVDRMSDSLFLNNWILNGLLIGVLLFLLAKRCTRSAFWDLKTRFWIAEIALVMVGYEIFSIWHKIYPDWIFMGNDFHDDCIRALLGILFYIHVMIAILMVTENEKRVMIFSFYLSAGMVSAPLLMANPIGNRCFYVAYIFQAMSALLLFRIALPKNMDVFLPTVVLGSAVLVIAVIYIWMFREIGRYTDLRSQIIETAIETNAKDVQLPILPYSDYCWQTVPPSSTWAKRFKKFYGLSKNVEITFYDVER